MLKSYFWDEEKEMLLHNVEDWQGLAGSGMQRDADGNLYSAKDNFIDNLVLQLFEMFPEHDLAQGPSSVVVMSQADRDKLHSCPAKYNDLVTLAAEMKESSTQDFGGQPIKIQDVYFTKTSLALDMFKQWTEWLDKHQAGGVTPSWRAIAEQLLAYPGGQKGKLLDVEPFQWREVPGKQGSVMCITTMLEGTPYAGSTLQYTKLENLYTQWVALEADASSSHMQWKGLPLARTTHIHLAYSVELYSSLCGLHAHNPQIIQLIEAVATLKQYGLVHLSNICAANCQTFRQPRAQELPYSTFLTGVLGKKISSAELLPAAFFNSDTNNHTSWSLSTLLAWITIQ
ncbi:hypothetical protein BDV93DRAFT_515887 [Ceratobasidium sp. AG-I]|nr:hypothetical protein BDV93DRAFT_515887 [Ceratobasidium sp. AG-I]